MTPNRPRIARRLLPLACSLLTVCAAGAALAQDNAASAGAQGWNRGENILHRICARQFEIAQKTDMESFRDYDAETFRAVHHEDAMTVFDSGGVAIGLDAVMNALAGHFARREAKWEWTERHRVVNGCRSAYILYETTYSVPRTGYKQRALTGVTYTHDGFKWLAIADQGTKLPPLPTP
ncbi:nuclear transport factor 2 family protein [Pseudomonas sp. CGJS7]|uniref:nuclear transport factor 2 family protein n=1 Tax=Pseudomonas sp. CGJS7 TaxID=3109348 RepID=UPI0030098C72